MDLTQKTDKTLAPVIIGGLCLLVSSFIWWLSTPLQWKINGYAIPIIGDPLSPEGFTKTARLFSFGSIGVLLFLLTVIFSAIKPCRRLILWTGMGGILLSVYFLLKIFFLDPGSLNAILHQQDQYNNLVKFSKSFLANTNIAQTGAYDPEYSFIVNMVASCFTYISIGFYTNALGGLILVVSSRRFYSGGYKIMLAASVAVCLAVTIVPGWRPVLSEWYLIKADKLLYSGFSDRATDMYVRAKKLNPNLGTNDNFYYKLGLGYYLSRRDLPPVHFFKGRNDQKEKVYDQGLREYNAAEAEADMRYVVSMRKNGLYIDKGLDAYADDYFYTAISGFAQSARIDPQQVQAHYFLSKAYLDINRFDQGPSYSESLGLLNICSDKVVRSDAYNLFAESNYKALSFSEGRLMYNKSLKSFNLVNRIMNFNASKGLGGL